MERLIEQLVDEGYLKSPEIIDAFKSVRREDFLPDEMRDQASLNIPLPIRFGQTISQPLTVAFMLELLQPKKGDKVLDVGTGSGWQAALIAHIVGPAGKVVGIERVPQLVQFANRNVAKYNLQNIKIIHGDGTVAEHQEAPFDRIIVAAAAKDGIPEKLIAQLNNNGRMIIPIGEWEQEMVLVTKDVKGNIKKETFPGFQFVPLVEGNLPPSIT